MNSRHNHQIPERKFIREAVFGFNDGLVSTFGLTAGVVGALASNHLVALAGLINAVAGGLSMSVGTYISTKSEEEVLQREIQQEKEALKRRPNDELEELIRIYKEKGFEGKQLKCIVEAISKDKKLFLKTMVDEELGITDASFKNPISASAVMFFYYVLGSVIPTAAYLLMPGITALYASVAFSIFGLFFAGVVKSKLTKRDPVMSGVEMVAVGILAAAVAYIFGALLHGWLGI